MRATDRRPIYHGVEVTTVGQFFRAYIGINPLERLTEEDWLAIPSQSLRTIHCGKVFHDGLNELEACRKTLAWYPHDLWLYLMACQWQRINQEEPFMARSGDAGDEIGSRVIAGRLVEDMMRLCILMEREYPPYAKWLGTAFSRLRSAVQLIPIFDRVFDSRTWKEREAQLSEAYLIVQRQHNALGVTDPVEEKTGWYFTRPYRVPYAARFVDALYTVIRSERVKTLPKYVGAVWQLTNSSDVLEDIGRCRALTTACQFHDHEVG